MRLCEIEALAACQDGSPRGAIAEGQLLGVVANSQSRPEADSRERPLCDHLILTLIDPPALTVAHLSQRAVAVRRGSHFFTLVYIIPSRTAHHS